MRTLTAAAAAALLALALQAAHGQDRESPASEATNPAQPSETASPTDNPADAADYKPVVGQAGKDVVWVPTSEALVERMLQMAAITPHDYLVDLGSGDGRTVITAAQRGTRAHGIEYNPDLVALARKAAEDAGVSDTATFAHGDIFESDFSDATVVTLFLLPDLNIRLRPILLDMAPGTRVVSNSFLMGDWQPDDAQEAGRDCQSFCRAYSWVVPAKVEGSWRLDEHRTLNLNQNYQELSGNLTIDGTLHALSDAKLSGKHIRFQAGEDHYAGEVDGDRISGTINDKEPWQAQRQP